MSNMSSKGKGEASNNLETEQVILDKFKRNLTALSDRIIGHVTILKQQKTINVGIGVLKLGLMTINTEKSAINIINNLATHSNEIWTEVDDKNPKFLELHLGTILGGLPEGIDSVLTETLKDETEALTHEEFFKFFSAFIKLTIKYVMLKKVITQIDEDGTYHFENDYMSHIDINKEIVERSVKSLPTI
jgi:hypothetical protein